MATYNPKLPSQVLTYFGLPSLLGSQYGSNSIRYDSTTISILRQIDRSRNRQIASFSNIHPDGRTNYTSPSNNLHWAWNATTSTWTTVGANTGSWIASLVSSDLPPLSPSSTATPTIGSTSTPTLIPYINNTSTTPTATPTPSLFIKCDPPTIYPNNTTFVGQKKYQIIFKTRRSNCDTNCSDKMIVNIKVKNLSKNIDNYYSFTVPDDAQSCCTSCDDNTNFQTIDEFYTTFIFDDLVLKDKYYLEAIIDSILPTPTNTPTMSATPTLTPTISATPTISITPSIGSSPTPTISVTPTIIPTVTITPTITRTVATTPTVTKTITPTISTTSTNTPTISMAPVQTQTPTPTISATPNLCGHITIFNVTNSGSSPLAYIINSNSNPTLNLAKGQTYIFNISAINHPFWIKTSPVTGTSDTYYNGVTNNGISNGTIIFTVPYEVPSTLYYICQIHGSMQGVINICNVPA